MRTNKKKLAALAMSVVMAASTMSLSAFAEEQVAAENIEAVAEVTEAAVEATEPSVWQVVGEPEFAMDGTVTWVIKDQYGTQKTENGQAKVVEETPATCTQPMSKKWSITILTKDYTHEFGYGDANGHQWGAATETVEKEATCTEEGVKAKVHTCSACDVTEKVAGSEVTIQKIDHVYETKVTYTAGNNTKVVDNKVELVDNTKDGQYTETVTKTCKLCGDVVVTSNPKTLKAGTAKNKAVITGSLENIQNESYLLNTDVDKIDASKIVLTDCSKPGKYEVGFYDGDGKLLSREPYTVSAGHSKYMAEPEAKVAGEARLLSVIRDKDGNITSVTSNSCIKKVAYYEIIKCASTTCTEKDHVVSKTEKIAEPAGAHSAKAESIVEVNNLLRTVDKSTGYVDADAYETFAAYAKKATSGIKLETTVTCEADGKATITYLCEECGKPVTEGEPIVVNVKALGHKKLAPKVENKVEATCTKDGSYDSVVYCANCNKVMEKKTYAIAKKAHTNVDTSKDAKATIEFVGSKVVDIEGSLINKKQADYAGITQVGLNVYARAVLKCDNCDDKNVLEDVITMDIVDVKKESGKGEAGSITLKASYTKKEDNKVVTESVTVPYFSSLAAYLERNPEKDPINGLHIDEDGVCRYYVNDEFQKDFSGIADYNGGQFFVANGVVCSKANGLNEYKGTWYYLANGQVQRGYNGLALYNGAWFYLTNGVLNTDVNGLVPYNGGTFLFSAGRLRNDVNGLWQNADGTWYFLALGQVQTQHTGVAIYDGSAFYVRNGKLAKDYKGTVVYDGATFNVVNGQLYGPVA